VIYVSIDKRKPTDGVGWMGSLKGSLFYIWTLVTVA